MIPSFRKFPLRTEFLKFRPRAKRASTPLFTAYSLPSAQSTRLAVVVPKKVSKLATTRNWLKRLTYNTLWPRVKDNSLDLVIIYKPIPLKKSLATKLERTRELNGLKFAN